MSLTDEEAFWNVHDVAAYLKVSESWVYLHSAKGRLPHRKIGGLLRFKPAEVRLFADSSAPVVGRVLSMSKSRP